MGRRSSPKPGQQTLLELAQGPEPSLAELLHPAWRAHSLAATALPAATVLDDSDNYPILWADGGLLSANPSPDGGSWCYIHVGRDGKELFRDSGVIEPCDIGLPLVSNNVSELWAVLMALESVPDGWAGTIHTDSQVTVRRLTGSPRFAGVPDSLRQRLRGCLSRLGAFQAILVAGHPSLPDIVRGHDDRGLIASIWNRACDAACTEAARQFMQRRTR